MNNQIPVVKIENIHDGWLDFSVNDKTFCDSYLDDFKEKILKLFTYDTGDGKLLHVNEIHLDGEGPMLHLVSWMNYDNTITVVWDGYEHNGSEIFVFEYKELIDVLMKELDRVDKDYNEKFVLKQKLFMGG